jgi:hypothetical protein
MMSQLVSAASMCMLIIILHLLSHPKALASKAPLPETGNHINYLNMKILHGEVPIHDFSKLLNTSMASMNGDASEDEGFIVYTRYINALRDHYTDKLKSYNDKDPAGVTRRCKLVVDKCKQEMIGAVPESYRGKWKYEVKILRMKTEV